MARISLVSCFMVLIASGFVLDAASETIKWKLHAKEPVKAKDLPIFTFEEVAEFLANLEANYPKTKDFQDMFKTFHDFLKHVCMVWPAPKNKDQMMQSKSKELENKLQALISASGVSGEMMATLKQDVLLTMKQLSALHTTIQKTILEHQNSKAGDMVTEEELKTLERVMLNMKTIFARFIKIVAEGHQAPASGASAPAGV